MNIRGVDTKLGATITGREILKKLGPSCRAQSTQLPGRKTNNKKLNSFRISLGKHQKNFNRKSHRPDDLGPNRQMHKVTKGAAMITVGIIKEGSSSWS